MCFFLNAPTEMKIDESNIHSLSMVLIRFNGEQKYTIREITLLVNTNGVYLNVTFMVLDSPSAYNIILRRPWIQNMMAVLSTFHQVIRFPTNGKSRILKASREHLVTTVAIQ